MYVDFVLLIIYLNKDVHLFIKLVVRSQDKLKWEAIYLKKQESDNYKTVSQFSIEPF